MKHYLLLFCAFCLSFSACREDDISGINKTCKEINTQLPAFKRKAIDLSGITSLKGSIEGYFDKGELAKATVTTLADTGRTVAEYYFDDETIICIKDENFLYNKPVSYNAEVAAKNGDSVAYDDSKTTMKSSYYYFYDGKMVKWLDAAGQVVPDNDRRFQYQYTVLLNDVDKLVRMLKDTN